MNELNWSRVGSKSITGIAGSGEIVPHDSHRAIAQLGSRAKVEADRDLDGGGPGSGSCDNLTLDLVSAAAANAPSLIKKMTRGRYRLLCLLMAPSGQSRHCNNLSAIGGIADKSRFWPAMVCPLMTRLGHVGKPRPAL